MKKIFKTFYAFISDNDLDNKISIFANENKYEEIFRSAPAIAVAENGDDFIIVVTATFKPKSIFEVDEEIFNTLK